MSKSKPLCFGDIVYGGIMKRCSKCEYNIDCQKEFDRRYAIHKQQKQQSTQKTKKLTRDIWACECGYLNDGDFICEKCGEVRHGRRKAFYCPHCAKKLILNPLNACYSCTECGRVWTARYIESLRFLKDSPTLFRKAYKGRTT